MTVSDHLGELRIRLVWCLLFYIPVVVFFLLNATSVLQFIELPGGAYIHHRLVFLKPTEALFTYIKIALVSGLIVTSPVFFYHVWRFIGPALTPQERGVSLAWLPVALALFLGGLAFGYFVFLPLAFRFLFSFTGPGLIPNITISSYVGFIMDMVLPFAIVFEWPVMVVIGAQIGFVSSGWLRKQRRWALLAAFVIAGAIAPPDAFSMLVMASPMVILYELGILLARLVERRRRRSARSEDM